MPMDYVPADALDEFAWAVRRHVYVVIGASGRPPSAATIALDLGATTAAVEAALRRLHDHHSLFLDPGGSGVRMAHPFSGVPTAFAVRSGGVDYWANCAWDALGIPAALHADAEIEAPAADGGDPIQLRVVDGALHDAGELVHFLLPVRDWFDDLVFT
jgi:hypothetical protein